MGCRGTCQGVNMRHRITLQKDDGVADAAGQPIPAWTDYRTCWANVKDVSGGEIQRGDQVEALVRTIVTIRYPSGRVPKPEDRVLFAESSDLTRTLNIDAVKRLDADRRYLELRCVEVQ